ncbi:hypothetical protein DPF_2439 [Desulfoplanes formicivorans]|uniref:Uncharacterized protein n=1 Tax=Desulfoplanes formicivorans TaxID=1592317 RepID=A0A194AK67_9BACT|nr:hypothetical protein DPF_2439 [Desulfoplanes formicivorans]
MVNESDGIFGDTTRGGGWPIALTAGGAIQILSAMCTITGLRRGADRLLPMLSEGVPDRSFLKHVQRTADP